MNDTLWRGEQLQTRLRIYASQSRFWMKRGLALWAWCSVMLLGIGLLTPVRAPVIGLWVWSSYTPFSFVSWQGKQYAAREIANWLNGTVYQGSPGTWLLWAVGWGFLPVIGLAGWGYWYLHRKEPAERHLRGTQLLTPEELQKRLQEGGKPGFAVGPVHVPAMLHRQHVLICGTTGSGKTNSIRQWVQQIVKTDDAAVIVDPEGEFVQEFYTSARGDVILNPFDGRCPTWTPWLEGTERSDYEAQAASLFPIPERIPEPAKYYRGIARLVYSTLLGQIDEQRAARIPELFAQPDELLKVLAGTNAATVLGQRDSEKRQSMLSTLQLGCAALSILPTTGLTWSAKEWVKKKTGWVFFTVREHEKELVLPLFTLWLDALANRLLSQPLHPEQTTWVVIDEVAAINPQPQLHALMERGRKYGVGVVLGLQNIVQLQELYGKAAAVTMLDQPATRLFLRVNNPETQAWVAKEVGAREVERNQESETAGPENMRDSVSRSLQRKQEEAILPSECWQLPVLTGFLKVGHYGVARVRISYAPLLENQPAFLPRLVVVHNKTAPVAVQTRRRALG